MQAVYIDLAKVPREMLPLSYALIDQSKRLTDNGYRITRKGSKNEIYSLDVAEGGKMDNEKKGGEK